MDGSRFSIQVVAGVMPGVPDEEYTRRWTVSTSEWQKAVDEHGFGELIARKAGEAAGYAGLLYLQQVNWVSTEWIWY